MKRNGIALGLVCALFACDAGEPEPIAEEKPEVALEQTAQAKGDADACFDTMVRARECTEQFIPALVAARVEVNSPAGIADYDAEHGRQALIDQARTEWASDSQDAQLRQTCSAMQSTMPADQLGSVEAAAGDCLAHSGCDEFVACIMPVIKPALVR